MTKQYQQAIKIAKHLGKAHRMANKAEHLLGCYKLSEALDLSYSDEQKMKMRLACQKLEEAQTIVDQVFAEIIGQAMIQASHDSRY